jgi:hypothetical protein
MKSAKRKMPFYDDMLGEKDTDLVSPVIQYNIHRNENIEIPRVFHAEDSNPQFKIGPRPDEYIPQPAVEDNTGLLISTTEVGKKTKGASQGFIGETFDKQRWLVKVFKNGITPDIPNCINEFVAFPFLAALFKRVNIKSAAIKYQSATHLGAPGIAIEFFAHVKPLGLRVKPLGLEEGLAINFFMGNDDLHRDNWLLSKDGTDLIAIDFGKCFMAQLATPEKFVNYFEDLITRWYKSYQIDFSKMKSCFQDILNLTATSLPQMYSLLHERVDFLGKHLPEGYLQESTFTLRTDSGYNLKQKQFESFLEYYLFITATLDHTISMLPDVIKILDQKLLHQTLQQLPLESHRRSSFSCELEFQNTSSILQKLPLDFVTTDSSLKPRMTGSLFSSAKLLTHSRGLTIIGTESGAKDF